MGLHHHALLAERLERPAEPELSLVEALEAQARAEALSGRKLSAACGLDHALWVRVRQGSQRFGAEACARIVAHYPQLRDAAARYLAESYDHPTLNLLEDASRLSRRPACR
jgi:hypothetical protein